MSFLRGLFPLVAVLALNAPTASSASPTPAPGGANQVNGIAGDTGKTLFNGVVRLKVIEVRDATPSDHPESIGSSDTQKVMVMTTLVRNALHRNFAEILSYTLADKDDVTFLIPDHLITPNPLNIQQAGAARQTALFSVAKDFTPVKLIVQCPTCGANSKFKPFRLTLPPSSAQK